MTAPIYRKGNSLRIDVGPLKAGWCDREMEKFFADRNVEPDGTCFSGTLLTNSQFGICDYPVISARIYNIENIAILGDYSTINDSFRKLGLHKDFVRLRQADAYTLKHDPKHILWAPGLYGKDLDQKAVGLGFCQVSVAELCDINIPIVLEMGFESAKNTVAKTGLYRLDERRLGQILREASMLKSDILQLNDESSNVESVQKEFSVRTMTIIKSAQELSGFMPD